MCNYVSLQVPYFGALSPSMSLSPEKLFSSPPQTKRHLSANDVSPHTYQDDTSQDSGLGDKDTPKV